jgi:hypothetical protein
MCVILICPPNVRPSRSILEGCATANPHGAGVAWREGGAVHWLKTDDVAEVERLARRQAGEIVIHFRIASVGRPVPELRHPFPITRRAGLSDRGSAGAVLFQNGTWSGWSEALKIAAAEGVRVPEGEMSDARAAALLLHGAGRDGRERFFAKAGLSRWVWFGARETEVYGDWRERGGIRYSNFHWHAARCAPAPTEPPKRPVTKLEAELDWLFERGETARDFYAHFPKPKARKMV